MYVEHVAIQYKKIAYVHHIYSGRYGGIYTALILGIYNATYTFESV